MTAWTHNELICLDMYRNSAHVQDLKDMLKALEAQKQLVLSKLPPPVPLVKPNTTNRTNSRPIMKDVGRQLTQLPPGTEAVGATGRNNIIVNNGGTSGSGLNHGIKLENVGRGIGPGNKPQVSTMSSRSLMSNTLILGAKQSTGIAAQSHSDRAVTAMSIPSSSSTGKPANTLPNSSVYYGNNQPNGTNSISPMILPPPPQLSNIPLTTRGIQNTGGVNIPSNPNPNTNPNPNPSTGQGVSGSNTGYYYMYNNQQLQHSPLLLQKQMSTSNLSNTAMHHPHPGSNYMARSRQTPIPVAGSSPLPSVSQATRKPLIGPGGSPIPSSSSSHSPNTNVSSNINTTTSTSTANNATSNIATTALLSDVSIN